MVDIIRALCKERGTSIYKLEKQLGFGNGVIGRWDKSTPSYDRLSAVANALNVPISALTGTENSETSIPKEDGRDDLDDQISKFIKLLTREQKQLLLAQLRVLTGD